MEQPAVIRSWLPWFLVVLVFVAYFPALTLGFVHWDDQGYVTANDMVQRGLTLESIYWAFTTFHASNYHPITWLSLMLDVELFGINSAGFHAVNLLLHLTNVWLAYALFRRISGSQLIAGLVAGILAIHPQHVESVAWIAERKDLLSTTFGLLAMLIYVGDTSLNSFRKMSLVSGLQTLSLLSKPTLVTLPCVLLLLDAWQLNRAASPDSAQQINWHIVTQKCREKWPLFVLSLALSILVMLAQRPAGSIESLRSYSTPLRVGNAIVSVVTYLKNAFWPMGLCAYYPHPEDDLNLLSVEIGVVTITAITAIAITWWRRLPSLLFGWLWYLGTLVPMLGIVQVGGQAMADRYTYLPMLGISFALASVLVDGLRDRTSLRKVALASVILATVICVPLTWRQISYWSSTERLWRRVLQVSYERPSLHVRLENAKNPLAHHCLALCLIERERFDEALAHLDAAIEENPYFADAWNNRGALMLQRGHPEAALSDFSNALRIKPSSEKYWSNHASALGELGRFEEARASLERAIEIAPKFLEAHWNRFLTSVNLRNPTQAAADFESYSRLAGPLPTAKRDEAQRLLQQATRSDLIAP